MGPNMSAQVSAQLCSVQEPPNRLDSALEAASVPESHRPHYYRWIAEYYRFCTERVLPAADSAAIVAFVQWLEQAGKPRWQCYQARQAVELMFQVSGHACSGPASCGPEPERAESTGRGEWDTAIESLERAIMLKRYSKSTLKNYSIEVRRFRKFVNDKPTGELTSLDAREYLEFLALKRNVAGSTQNVAFNALLFLYRHVLEIPFEDMEKTARAKRPKVLPTVLRKDECAQLFSELSGVYRLVAELAYGCGLRVSEVVGLRTQDLDLEKKILIVRRGKGNKDRSVPLPESLIDRLGYQLRCAKKLFDSDSATLHYEGVFLPEDLENRRGADAWAREFAWYWVFPAPTLTELPDSGDFKRYHLHETAFQRKIREATRVARINKRVTPHTLRHSFGTHLLEEGYNIRQVQELLGHVDVRTTMVYLHVMRNEEKPLRSPLDILKETVPPQPKRRRPAR